MKITHILPALNEGGVERHVLTLSCAQAKRGNQVTVVSAGGPLVRALPGDVAHVALPVHRKNPALGLSCAVKIAALARKEKWDVLHAHSRVPAWIALLARNGCRSLFVATAHARYSKNFGLFPLGRADGLICVSKTVRDYLAPYVRGANLARVIYNPRHEQKTLWHGSGGDVPRLLFVGRLTRIKGVEVLIEALANLRERNWTLDIVGTGPMAGPLAKRISELGLQNRVLLRGHSNEPWTWMEESDLFCFPSLDEGMGLALTEALQCGIPVLASDLPSVQEITGVNPGLLPAPGDTAAWTERLKNFLDGGRTAGLQLAVKLPSTEEAACQTESFYQELMHEKMRQQI